MPDATDTELPDASPDVAELLAVRDALCEVQCIYQFVGEALRLGLRYAEVTDPQALADGATVVLADLAARDTELCAALDAVIATRRIADG